MFDTHVYINLIISLFDMNIYGWIKAASLPALFYCLPYYVRYMNVGNCGKGRLATRLEINSDNAAWCGSDLYMWKK